MTISKNSCKLQPNYNHNLLPGVIFATQLQVLGNQSLQMFLKNNKNTVFTNDLFSFMCKSITTDPLSCKSALRRFLKNECLWPSNKCINN